MPMKSPWADEKLLFSASATSIGVLDSCTMSDHPSLSIINTEQKNLSTVDINHDYTEKIMEVNHKLDMVKNIVRPGCSHEVLNTALSYMSSLATILYKTPQKPHASL